MNTFLEICHAQGGDVSYLQNPEKYPSAKYIKDVKATQEGYISAIDTTAVGMAAVKLGAGRLRAEDNIDPTAGIKMHAKLGDRVSPGTAILTIHTQRPEVLEEAENRLLSAIQISEKPPKLPALILKEIC